MIENLIIKLFINDYYMYLKYYKYIKLSYIKTNYTNLYKLFIIIHKYYTKVNSNEVVNKSISKADLLTEYNLNYFLEDSERDEI